MALSFGYSSVTLYVLTITIGHFPEVTSPTWVTVISASSLIASVIVKSPVNASRAATVPTGAGAAVA